MPVEFVPLEVANRIPALTRAASTCCSPPWRCCRSAPRRCSSASPMSPTSSCCSRPKIVEIKTNADMGKYSTSASPRASAQDTQVTKNAPAGTNIRRFDGDAAAIQALRLRPGPGARRQHVLHRAARARRSPASTRTSSSSPSIYNGACTRLGEKEINAAINAFIDKIKANGELQKIYDKWMKRPLPHDSRDSIEGVPFVRRAERAATEIGAYGHDQLDNHAAHRDPP